VSIIRDQNLATATQPHFESLCIERSSPVSCCIVQSFNRSQVMQTMSAFGSIAIAKSRLTQVSRIMQAGPTSTWTVTQTQPYELIVVTGLSS
jgi:hypothetical protein